MPTNYSCLALIAKYTQPKMCKVKKKAPDILQQIYYQTDIRMRLNGFRQLVDHKPVASCPRSFVKKL